MPPENCKIVKELSKKELIQIQNESKRCLRQKLKEKLD
jgi:hypothetical protein